MTKINVNTIKKLHLLHNPQEFWMSWYRTQSTFHYAPISSINKLQMKALALYSVKDSSHFFNPAHMDML